MTKEELKQEVEEWTKDHSGLIGSYKFVKYDYDSMQKAYLAGAEPREKQIQIDAEQIRALQKDKGELTDKVKELEAQNEEIENYFVESAGYGRDKVRNFMDIVNKALKQKGERITELETSVRNLRRDNKELQEVLPKLDKENDELKYKLTNAKEIIKDLLSLCEGETDSKLVFTRAEQFLKETEQ